MKNKKINLLVFSSIIAIMFFSTNSISQEKFFELLQGDKLSGMTPEQIREKIAEGGLSEAEAIQIAREKNVDLDKYLKQEVAARATIEKREDVSPELQILRAQISRKPKISFLPAFKSRSDLPPYGYELFNLSPTTFEPVVNVATPESYQIGPGDEIILNIWGQAELSYQLTVNRDGYIIVPNAGKIQVDGLTIQQAKQKMLLQLTRIYEGLSEGKSGAATFLDLSLGKLRTIQVFVVGEVQQPGGYLLSGLSTAYTALYYAGGPNANGSLRRIQVKRDSKVIANADFYEFALSGNKNGDVQLRDGDVLYIQSAGTRVAIEGNIIRPAIYELKPEETLQNLFKYSGGLNFDAYTKRIHIERVIPFNERAKYSKDLLDIDINFNSKNELMESNFQLEDGDVIKVFSVNQERENLVTINGNVWKPGDYALTEGMKVRDLVKKADGLREDTFTDQAMILRTRLSDLKKEIITINLSKAMSLDTENNLILQRLDVLTVYKDDYFKPRFPVSIHGSVKTPGTYPLTENMTLSDLLLTAGGIQAGADLGRIEIARVDTSSKQIFAKLITVSLPEDFWNFDRNSDFLLEENDIVFIRMKTQYRTTKTVRVEGEVEYPGIYAIEYNKEKLSSLIRRFGGFKNTAYLDGIRFVRSTEIGGVNTAQIANQVQTAIDTLGRPLPIPLRLAAEDVPIDIKKVLTHPESRSNLELEEGDVIIVPRDPGVVYVQGQVNLPASVPYKKGTSLSYYLTQAGGLTPNGDEKNIVVVLPNKRRWEPSGFILFPDPDILSGSTITVPFKLKEKDNTLQILREWATISLSTATIGVLIWQVSK